MNRSVTIEAMHEFVVFAKFLNFSKAAMNLNLSQSSMSKHIADLERETGLNLVEREPKVQLTSVGQLFLEQCAHLTKLYDENLAKCRQIQYSSNFSLRLRQPEVRTPGYLRVTYAFRRMRDEHPGVKITFVQEPDRTSLDALLAKSIDVGWLISGKPQEAFARECEKCEIDLLLMTRSSLKAWMRDDHPLARKQTLDIHDLADVSILVPAGKAYDEWIPLYTDILNRYGVEPHFSVKSVDSSDEFFMLNPRQGIYLLDSYLVKEPLFSAAPDMTLRSFGDTTLDYDNYVAWRKTDNNPLIAELAEYACENIG